MTFRRLGPFSRLLALVLSWAVPATTVWASAPPAPAVHVNVTRELANRWTEPGDMDAASDASPTGGLTEAGIGLRSTATKVGMEPRGGEILARHGSFTSTAADPAAAVSGGVVVGSVVSDATGLPLAGAGVRLVGSPDPAVPTDLDGRYLVPVPTGEAVLVIEKEGFVPVERRAAVASGAGVRAPDARLTPLATPVTVGPAGGPVAQGPVRLSVPPGAVTTDTGFILTLLSPQGLPGRLPLGWASVVGFDLRAGRPITGSLTAAVRDLPSGTAHFVAYQDHAWRLLSSHTVGITGELGLSLEGLGAFALVRADDGGPAVPGIGEVLPGVDAVALPSGITGTAVVVPAQVPATGATALGRVSLVSPQALPSGSVVEARSVESFTVDGVSFTDEERVQDVVVQRSEPNAGTSLRAEFPLTALRTFDATVPVHGRLHLEVWARGDSAGSGTVGGQDAVSLESGGARLDVAAGSLAENTLIRFAWIGLDGFLPVGAGYAALGEVMVDFSGATLGSSAELSLLDPGVGTDTVVVAKVERYEGVPYLSVVSLAERLNGRLVSRSYPGLPGIVRSGKYVFYRLTNPVGFVAGTTTSPLGPVQAVVSPEGLPFVGISDGAGSYITASPVGSVQVRAFVPRTPHQAEGVVTVTANQTTSLNLVLSGGLTTVVVTPEDGAIGVPVSSSVQLETSQPLAPGSVSPSSVKLYQGNPSENQALAVRLVLSVSGKSLAVIPETALLPATAYTLRVTGLLDAYGGPVSVPDVRFTTRANDEPSYDLSRIVFSFPDQNGMIQVRAPAGTLAAATTVLIVNSGNGVVLSLTADNDGALSGELPGSLDDRMLVTVTDPLGRTQSLTITKYVDVATGRTSIGATGGVVEGLGGVELRLPDGAVDQGVIFKIQAVSPASIPVSQRPEIPDSHLGAVLQIEAPSMPRFRKEVDLVFPKPADAPEGAFYYVYRKILGPDGVVIHEALDSASVQGAKVVTNSPPFSGYTDSVGAFAFGVGGLAISGVASSITYLMWTIDQLVPGRASAGAISGSVLCGRWNRSTGQYDYVGVPGAIVRPIWGEQDPVLAGGTVTRSGGDGGYAFFEGRYSGGGIKLRATIPASLVGCAGTKDAMGYGAPKPTWALSYTAYATANITFTAVGDVPPEPRVDIRLLKQVDGAWRFSEGVETTGQALLIGVTVAEATLSEARVDGGLLTLRDAGSEHLGMAQVADYTPGTTGVHTVTVKVNPAQGSPVTVSSSFLAIADGSDNNTPLPGRPEVIALASVPRNGATSVPVTVLPEIRFTEPVKNVPGNITLHPLDSEGNEEEAVAFGLFGVGPDGPVTEVTALSKVSSLTLQPSNSLEHGKKYRLSLTEAIVDLDPDPEGSQPLVPFSSEFETYDPTVVGTSGETYTSAGVVVSGERAYVLENQFERGLLRTYDVSDPEQPRELGGPWMVLGRAVDLKGEKASPVLPENPDIVVAGTTVNWRSRPSNLHVFDVSSGRPSEIGAVSVSASSLAGTLSRFVVKGTRAFTITWHRGVQEVDLTRAVRNYQATDFFTRNRDLNTSGRGFGMNAVMQTIPVVRGPNQHWLMRDLKVGDYVQDGQSQPIVWVTGDLGLAWVNPQAGGHGPPLTLSLASGRRLGEGTALALGRLGSQDVAVVVGGGVVKDANGVDVPGSVLAVVDLGEVLHPSTPAKPKVLSIIPLFGGDFVLGGQPQDVLLVEHMAVVSSATKAVIVDLGTGETAGTAPAVIGALDGVAGRLTLGDDGLLYSAAYSVTGEPDPLGGLRLAALTGVSHGLLDLLTPTVVLHAVQDPVNLTMCGSSSSLAFRLHRGAEVTLRVRGEHFQGTVDGVGGLTLRNLPLRAGTHVVTIGRDVLPDPTWPALDFDLEAYDPETGDRKALGGRIENDIENRPVFPVGHVFVKGVDMMDGHVVHQVTDLRVPGRHLGLEVTRTYSSAGQDSDGVLGANWSWSLGSGLFEGGCGLVSVSTSAGSQVFRESGDGVHYTPQNGYHARLVRNAAGSFDFTDKSGNVHHFGTPGKTPGSWRLDFTREPHGDRLVPAYDSVGQVVEVSEVQGTTSVRTLRMSYRRVGAFDRVTSISAYEGGKSLALRVAYRYDPFGNLVGATRTGTNLTGVAAAERTEGYEYALDQPMDRYQLTARVDANGRRTEYAYHKEVEPLPGVPSALRREFAKEVREFPSEGTAVFTRFGYDHAGIASGVFEGLVTDPMGRDTTYTMNVRGNPTRIGEPLGKVTLAEWHPTDVLKTKETDALGRVTSLGYDDRGNLTSERIQTADFGTVETTYAYDPTFNRVTYKRDAEGRETRYEIDAATGDLLSTTDALGNITRYRYDAHGQLQEVTDPRGHRTLQSDHDSFGNARRVTDAVGNLTTREYDLRGRLTRQADTLSREATTLYDGMDRPVLARRVARGFSDDEVTRTTYYPDGQVRSITNANGAVTTYTLDGMNRVVRTSTDLGDESPALATSTEYDANGNKVTEADRRGVTKRSTFDALNRRIEAEVVQGLVGETPTGTIATYGYDLAGNQVFETDVAGNRTDLEYDGLYRVKKKLLAESGPGGRYFEEYAYDRVGNRTSVKDANGHATSFAYDGLSRLTRTTNALGHVVEVTYLDPEGSKVNKSEERDRTRGLRTTFTYDALNRETERKVFLEGVGSNGEVYTTGTAYEDSAHALAVTDPQGHVTRSVLDGLDHVVEQTVDASGLGLQTRIAYDGLGNKKAVTDPENHTTVHGYDGLGRLVKVRDAAQKETVLTYDGEGLKLSENDRRGVTKVFTYDNLGRPRKTSVAGTISGKPWSQEIQYQDVARKRSSIDARGKVTTFDLDGLGRVVKATDPLSHFTLSKWDGVVKREETDKRGNRTSFDHDALNRLIKATDPPPFQAQTLETTFEDAFNRKTDTDRKGIQSTTQTDPLGRVLTVTRGGVVQETSFYDGDSQKVRALDAEGKQTHFAFDAGHRLSSRIDDFGAPGAATTSFTYDRDGNQTEELDQRALNLSQPFSVRRTYDELHRLRTEEDGEAHVTTYAYDEEGNRTQVREPQGQETSYAYDELGKLTRVVQPGSITTSYRYDRTRNKVEQEDALNRKVAFEYDQLSRLTKLIQPGAVTTDHVYDENGNETLLTDPKGQTVTSTYDELNRLKTKSYAFATGDSSRPWRYATGVAYAYDPNGNLTAIDESVAGTPDPTLTTTHTYDGLDRLASETTELPDSASPSRTVSFGYYGNGTRKTVTDPAGQVTFYSYDGQNRLQAVTTAYGTPEAAITTYSYWPDNLLKEVTLPSGVKATHSYDKADRLTMLLNAKGATVLSSYAYGYDHNGNRTSQVEVNGGTTETTGYDYDDLNRLKTITYPVDATYANGRVVTYGYDPVGNRTQETERDNSNVLLSDKAGVFDDLNRLTALNDLVTPANSTTFAWDNNGNQITKTKAGVTTSYHYDVRDKLVEVGQGASILGRFQYDFEGRRNVKIGEFGTEQYVYDGTSTFLEYDQDGTLKAKYDYGSDRLIGVSRAAGSLFERRYYSFDALRSVTNLSDTSGAVKASYHQDAWGNFRFPSELNADGDTVAAKNRFAFTGYLWDKETNLFFAKARFYDPEVGRFISQDSYLGKIDEPPSLHRYFYANANPTFYTDPTGQYSWSEFESDAKWGKDFIVAFGSDLAQNAPARAGKIAEATGRNAVNMAKETGANIHDAAVLGYEVATGRDTGIALRSSVAQQAGARMAAGESAGSITKDIVGNTAANVATFGIYGTAKEQYGALRDFSQGKGSITDVENRLADAAGGNIVNLGVTAAFLKGTTGSVKGPDLGAAAKTVVEGASQLPSKARAALEGGLDRLHDAIGTSDFTTLGRIEPPSVPKSGTAGAARAERLAGSKVEHMNAAIAEQHGYAAALEKGQIGIQAPGKVTARGPDYVTFDPRRGDVVVWDSKYRGPTGGSAPSTVPATKLQRWAPEVKAAIEAMPDGPAKAAAQAAFQAGKIRGEVFKWPQ